MPISHLFPSVPLASVPSLLFSSPDRMRTLHHLTCSPRNTQRVGKLAVNTYCHSNPIFITAFSQGGWPQSICIGHLQTLDLEEGVDAIRKSAKTFHMHEIHVIRLNMFQVIEIILANLPLPAFVQVRELKSMGRRIVPLTSDI